MTLTLFVMGQVAIAGNGSTPLRMQTNIPPEPLGVALQALARHRNFQIAYVSEQVDHRRTQGAVGNLTVDEALARLLRGTGLTFDRMPDNGIRIVPVSADAGPAPHGAAHQVPVTENGTAEQRKAQRSFSQPFRLGQPTRGDSPTTPAVASRQSEPLQEVVVTAQRRTQLVQDVPIAMSVVSTSALTQNNQPNISDYFSSIPGLNFANSTGDPTQTITIRGITTGANNNPTVGIMIDDFPFGASVIGATSGSLVPSIDPSDLQRIEVLRGPQGTLYGASSMGGLIKFVTVDPTFTSVSGEVSAGTDSVSNASQLGYTTHAAINIPLSGTLAARASGFYRREPGYIDNTFLGTKDVNDDHAYGGLLTALWQPSDRLSVKALALYQNTIGDAFSLVTPPPGVKSYQQDFAAGTGYNFGKAQMYGLTVHYTLGEARFTLASGYGVGSGYTVGDFSSVLGSFNPLWGFNVSGEQGPFYQSTSKWTEEAQLRFPVSSRVDVLMGAFFTHEVTHFWQSFLASDPRTGAVAGTAVYYFNPNVYIERAGFADATFHITRRLDVQLGGRESNFTQDGQWSFVEGPGSPFFGNPTTGPHINPAGPDANESTFTYLVTPRLKLTPNLMTYVRAASGYRPGGITPLVDVRFKPDKTRDYEAGIKGRAWGGRLSFDAAAYYIDWKDIQLGLISPQGVNYTGNAGAAKSQGLELATQMRTRRGLRLSAWVNFTEAVLTEAFPQFGSGFNAASAAYGVAGDPLPWSSRFSAYVSAEQAYPLSPNLTGIIGADVSYQGGRLDTFTGTPQRQHLSPYAKVDAHAGFEAGSWTINAYVNNLMNRYVLLSGGAGNIPPVFNVLQPRTVGISASRKF